MKFTGLTFEKFTLFLALSTLLIVPAVSLDAVYAQLFPKIQSGGKAPAAQPGAPPTSTSTPTQQKTIHRVKITTPTKAQEVTIGKNLSVAGTSQDNATADCTVGIIVNRVKGYQPVIPTGPGGQNDYSQWKYTLTSQYTTLKEGQNKITARFSCANDPTLTSHSSVNVTGVAASQGVTTANSTQNSSSNLPLNNNSITTQPSAAHSNSVTNGTNTSSSAVQTENMTTNSNASSSESRVNNLKQLSVLVDTAKKSVTTGHKQTITVTVLDLNSNQTITGANVKGNVTYSSSGAITKIFTGITDSSGKDLYSWKLGSKDKSGKYNVDVLVSVPGYENKSGSTTFKVKALKAVTSSSSSPSNSSGSPPFNLPLPSINPPSSIIQIPGPSKIIKGFK